MPTMPDTTADAFLDQIALSTQMFICTSAPANHAAIAGVALNAAHTLTAGDGNGDWVIADGDTSGRKLSITQQSITYNATGSGTHVAYSDGTTMHWVQDLDQTYSITSGETRTFDAGKVVELPDPA